MKSFAFSSGIYVPEGNLIAVPQEAVMKNGDLFPDPESFRPERYLPAQKKSQATEKFTDVNYSYPYWGSPRKAWSVSFCLDDDYFGELKVFSPGRWYVSSVLKQAMVHLYMNYDFRLADKNAPKTFFWTTAIVPRLRTQILLKRRERERQDSCNS